MDLTVYFEEWPFSVVPMEEEAGLWADREEVMEQVDQLFQSFGYRPQSTVDLVWAAFGAGKTHLLYHIANRVDREPNMVPAYSIVPEGIRSFDEVYRGLMDDFPLDELDGGNLSELDEDHPTYPALYAYLVGNEEQQKIAENWLRGRRVDMRSAPKHVALPYKLETSEQMQQVFRGLVQALVSTGNRLVLLLDEYKRVRTHTGKAEGKLGGLLLDTFNAIPKGLSIVVSVSATQRATAYDVLPSELVDRMQGRRAFSLPELSEEDAFQFCRDLFSAHRPNDYDGTVLAPYSEEAIEIACDYLREAHDRRLIPRHLIQVLDSALDAAIRNKEDCISEEQVLEAVDSSGEAARA